MQINVFRGGRRIAIVLAAIATAFVLYVTYSYTPNVSIYYRISRPGSPPVRTADHTCPSTLQSYFFFRKTPKGNSVNVNLCLLTMPFGQDHKQLVPYKIDASGMIWGAAPYSSEVNAYESNIEKNFVLPQSDSQWVDQQFSKLSHSHWRHSIRNLIIGLVIFWIVVAVLGWIVRGFAGIAPGRDHRGDDA